MRKAVQVFLLLSIFYFLFSTRTYAQSCPATSGESYGQLRVPNPFPGNPNNQELNPQPPNRQWTEVNEDKGLCQYGYPAGQPPDTARAPKLSTLVGTDPTQAGAFTRTIKVSNSNWPVSFLCFKTSPCQEVRAPQTGYNIGGGYNYLVLYADDNFITLANFAEDMIQHDLSKSETLGVPVLGGYTIHVANIVVDQNLLQLYRTLNSQGRNSLPAVKAGQVIGFAPGNDFCVSIRDSDDFMDPRSRNDWWGDYLGVSVPYCQGGPSVPGGVINQEALPRRVGAYCETPAAMSFPDESREICPGDCGPQSGPPTSSSKVPIYVKSDGRSIPEMRDNADLSFGLKVQGMGCGQARSDSIVFEETATYDLFSQNTPALCENEHEWVGNLTTSNLYIPFAQPLAEHWAGKFDAEHLDEKMVEEIRAKAAGQGISFPEEQFVAQNQIWQESGVLGKLLPQETQDDLKAEFIDYVKMRVANNLTTMYANFAIDGVKLTDIESAPPMPSSSQTAENPELMSSYYVGKQAWRERWRHVLDKMALFPNEQAKGQIKVALCGDRLYQDVAMLSPSMETMKMGLAADMLFKILEPQEKQEAFYQQIPELKAGLKILDGTYLTGTPSQPTLATINPPTENSPANSPKDGSWLDKLKALLGGLKSAALSALAQAQDSFHIDVGIDSAGNVTVKFFSDGCDGDIRLDLNGQMIAGINAWNRNVNNPFVYGPPYTGPQLKLSAGESQTLTYTGTIVRGPRNCGNQTSTVSCTVSADNAGNLSSNCGVPSTPTSPPRAAAPPTCNPEVACCVTPHCQAKSFKNVQYGPPYTMGQGVDSLGDLDLGYDWPMSRPLRNPVKLVWKKDDWRDYSDTTGLPADCKFQPLPAGEPKQSCSANKSCPNWGSTGGWGCTGQFCAPFVCVHTNERTADVYNNVPYLWSSWMQAADGGNPNSGLPGGFLTMFKPEWIGAPPVEIPNLNPNCRGKQIDPNKYYSRDKCEVALEPTCCQGNPQDCEWSDRWWCTQEQCAKIENPATDCGGGPCHCGAGLSTFYTQGGILKDNDPLLQAQSGGRIGCSSDFSDVFQFVPATKRYIFNPTPGAAKVSYGFNMSISNLDSSHPGIDDVRMTTPMEQSLLFYRLGGLCNADKWFSEKYLLPAP